MTPAPRSALSRRSVYPIRTRRTNLQQIRQECPSGCAGAEPHLNRGTPPDGLPKRLQHRSDREPRMAHVAALRGWGQIGAALTYPVKNTRVCTAEPDLGCRRAGDREGCAQTRFGRTDQMGAKRAG